MHTIPTTAERLMPRVIPRERVTATSYPGSYLSYRPRPFRCEKTLAQAGMAQVFGTMGEDKDHQ